MDPIERARQLRQEADTVLRALDLHRLLEPYGPITFVGSYYLDVMVYPDIDVCVPPMSFDQLFRVAVGLAACEHVWEVKIQKSRDSRLPGGLYLKPQIRYGSWERDWKLDLWSLSQAIIDENAAEMLRLKAAMTEDLRGRIIRYKHSVLTGTGRTPMHSGYFIYKAFIDEGLTDHAAVTRYLIANGVSIESGSDAA